MSYDVEILSVEANKLTVKTTPNDRSYLASIYTVEFDKYGDVESAKGFYDGRAVSARSGRLLEALEEITRKHVRSLSVAA